MSQTTTARPARVVALIAAAFLTGPLAAEGPPKKKWVQAKAYVVPKETAPEGEGYFAIIEGHNGRLYIGTHANAVNSWLVEFDPAAERMKVVVDAHKAIGKDLKGFGAQAKIHTRNNVGASGKIYFGTKQGYPDAKKEKYTDYPGGYPMTYDPKTGKTHVFPIPVKHHGINSITPDEARGVAYVSTCSDHKPGPDEGAHFLILDLKTEKYRDLIDTKHSYGFIVVDYLGRAYHPMLGGDIIRFTPSEKGGIEGGKLERLKQTIDGKPPAADSHLADPKGHPINWDISPDGKTLYSVPMSTNQLYAYDLTARGDTLPGRSLGKLVPEAVNTDCRAMCVGPKGEVWVALTGKVGDIDTLLNLVSYRPGDKAPRNHGPVAVSNPNYTEFKDKSGKVLPFHGGLRSMPDGTVTTRYVILGVCQGKDGSVYMLMLHPYTVLKVTPQALGAVGDGARSRQGPKLFAAYPLTRENEFTAGIEGPACDAAGNVYAVNYAKQGTIGRVTPGGAGEVWVTLPGKSVGNGIVFDKKGMMYVADYVGHNVLRIDPATKAVSVFAHEDRFNQPNDLAIALDGTLYASDPNWGKSTGQVWKIDNKGKVTLAAGDMGTTNGIEVGPDGKTLYVNESVQRNIWAFTIGADGALSNKRLLKKFEDFGFDGMRCDVDGNLFITRHGKGTVVVLSPAGKVLHEVKVLGKFPSNLCFGGQDGKTVYVTEVEHRRLVQFRVDRPGLAWQRWQKNRGQGKRRDKPAWSSG
jgi:sugar lactone lactonase YvrE